MGILSATGNIYHENIINKYTSTDTGYSNNSIAGAVSEIIWFPGLKVARLYNRNFVWNYEMRHIDQEQSLNYKANFHQNKTGSCINCGFFSCTTIYILTLLLLVIPQ